MTSLANVLQPADDDEDADMFRAHGEEIAQAAELRTVDMAMRLYDEAASGLLIKPDGANTLSELRIRAGRRYMGDQWDSEPATGRTHQSIPDAQNAVITQTATQNEQSPQIMLTAVETDSAPEYYLSRRGYMKLMIAMTEGRIQMTVDLSPLQGGGMVEDEAIGVMLEGLTIPRANPMTGDFEPVLIEGTDLLIVTDATNAEALQTILDRQFAESFWDFYWLENSTNANIFGNQAIVFSWDTKRHRGMLHNPNFTNVLHDPISTWTHNTRYEILTEYISASRAIKEFPRFAKSIANQSQEFNASATDDTTQSDFSWNSRSNYGHVNWDSSLVAIRTFWVRDVPYRPMEEGDAVNANIVEPIEQQQIDPATGEAVLDEMGLPVIEQIGYRLVDTGDETVPGAANWPTEIVEGYDDYDASGVIDDELSQQIASGEVHLGIRQFKILIGADRVIEDLECPYENIPMTSSKNIPLPFSPYGLGEPIRLESLLHAKDVVFSILYDNCRYDGMPQSFLPASIASAIEKSGAQAGTPNSAIVVDDEDFKEFRQLAGEFGFAIKREPIYESLVRFLDHITAAIDRLSNNTEAIQGTMPTSDTSGRAIEALQSGTRGLMKFKSETLQMAVEWVGRLWVDAIVNWLPDEEWDKYLSKYPSPIRQKIREKARTTKYDIRAEVVAGRGASKRADQEKALAQIDRGALSKESFLKAMEHPDPKGELQKINDELIKASMGAQPQVPTGDNGAAKAASGGRSGVSGAV
jgi:hypothetical protein